MPSVTGDKLVKALVKLGFRQIRQRGSHVTLVHDKTGRVVVVPVHRGRDLTPGTLGAILSAVGLSIDELRKLLR